MDSAVVLTAVAKIRSSSIGSNHRESQRADVSWVFSGTPGVRRVGAQPSGRPAGRTDASEKKNVPSANFSAVPLALSQTMLSPPAPSPDMLKPANVFSSFAPTMAARAPVTH